MCLDVVMVYFEGDRFSEFALNDWRYRAYEQSLAPPLCNS